LTCAFVALLLAFALAPRGASAHIIPKGGVQVNCTNATVTVSVTAWTGKVEIKNLTSNALTLKGLPDGVTAGDVVFTIAEIGGNGSYVAERETALDPLHTDPVPVPFTVDCTPPHGTLQAKVFLCDAGAQTTTPEPGSFTFTGPSSGSGDSPLSQSVLASPPDYVVTATAGTGFTLVTCGSSVGTATVKSTTVPPGGSGSVIFYESQNPPPNGTLEARIFLCDNGAQTTTPEPGSFTFTGPSSGSGDSPLSQSVAPSPPDYVVVATAGTNFTLVTCGSNIGTATTKSTTVPSNSTGSVTFYEARDQGNLAANIFLCDGVTQTTIHPAANGSLQVDGGVVSAVNSLPSTPVPTGSHLVNATAPPDFHLVTCGSYNGAASLPVTVTKGSTSVVNFYVTHDTGSLSGHIFDCTNGATTTEVPGGTLSASGPTNVPAQANPLGPKTVDTGSYTMTATAPADYHLAVCGAYNGSSTLPVTVTTQTPGSAIFYVARNSGGIGAVTVTNPPATAVKAATISAPKAGLGDDLRAAVIGLLLVLVGSGTILATRRRPG
jgi:hypothetical protein